MATDLPSRHFGWIRTKLRRLGGLRTSEPPCNHEWEYMEHDEIGISPLGKLGRTIASEDAAQRGETYTGYCERCVKCGEIVQVVQ